MCCLRTSNIYIIRNSTFSLASISSHIGYGQPNSSVEIIQVHHSSSFVLKKTEDDTTVSLDNIPFSLEEVRTLCTAPHFKIFPYLYDSNQLLISCTKLLK